MAMSHQEISDRMEINNLLIDYCSAVDAREIDAFDTIFTPDAFLFIAYTGLITLFIAATIVRSTRRVTSPLRYAMWRSTLASRRTLLKKRWSWCSRSTRRASRRAI